MTELSGSPGFAPPLAGKKLSRRRAVAFELVATVTLTISLVVAATACRSATGRCWSGPRPPRRRRRSSITRKGGSAFCGHSGSRANGPARSGRPDDKAPRGRPQSMTTGSDYGFRARGRAPAPRNDESRRADLAQQATAPPPLDRIGVNLTGGADPFTDCATDSCELRSYERGAFLAPGRRSGA
jgi:hypothetical protein